MKGASLSSAAQKLGSAAAAPVSFSAGCSHAVMKAGKAYSASSRFFLLFARSADVEEFSSARENSLLALDTFCGTMLVLLSRMASQVLFAE